ncbi:MAG: four helix bundle protein [Vicinamibacterales bacterium]|nr:four helix bundle protein [Vicinamibacterales bacterium]
MQDFRRLFAWQKAHALVLRTYEVSAAFPKSEQYGLTSQMRRAAVSIPANIAEGCCRGSRGELARYLRIALGSAGELDYYATLAADLRLLDGDLRMDFASDIEETKRVLSGLLKAVVKSTARTDN